MPDRRWNSQVVLSRTSEGPPQNEDHPARGEEHNDDLQAESDRSQPSDTLTVDGETRNDFLDDRRKIHYRQHVEPRVILCVRSRVIPNTTRVH